MEGWWLFLGVNWEKAYDVYGSKSAIQEGPWAPKAVSGTKDLEGMDKLGQRLK